MRKTSDHASGDLFDPWAFLDPKRRQILEEGWAGLFRREILPNLPVGKLAGRFATFRGRPTKDLYVALGVLILQQMHDLPDVATVEAVGFNLAWQYALDIRDNSQ